MLYAPTYADSSRKQGLSRSSIKKSNDVRLNKLMLAKRKISLSENYLCGKAKSSLSYNRNALNWR